MDECLAENLKNQSLFIAALMFAAFLPGTLHADTISVSLRLEKADDAGECPSAHKLKREVAARLGYDPFDGNSAKVFSVVVTTESGGRPMYRADIFLRSGEQESKKLRNLTAKGPKCAVLAEAIVLTIATAIDPTVSTSGTEPGAGNDPAIAMELAHYRLLLAGAFARAAALEHNSRGKERSRTAREPERTSLDTSWRAIGGAGLARGTSPSTSFFPVLGVNYSIGNMALRLEGRYEFSTAKPVGAGRYETSLLASNLGVCGVSGRLSACGLFEVGTLRQRGEGLAESRTERHLHVAAGGRIGVDFDLTERTGLRLRGEVLGNITAIQTTVSSEDPENDPRTVWETPPVSGRVGVLGFWRF